MKNSWVALLVMVLIVLSGGVYLYNQSGPSVSVPDKNQITYINTKYNFEFALPMGWEGYTIVESSWRGFASEPSGEIEAEQGPLIFIRHPQWTETVSRQDIPVMIFTAAQWSALQSGAFHVGAAPIDPSELGHNAQYVFALPARYNYAFPVGYEEVEQILKGSPLKPL